MSALVAFYDPAGADPRVVAALLPALADRGPAGAEVLPLGPVALGLARGDEDGEDASAATFEGWTVLLDGVPRNLRPLRDELGARGRVPADAPAALLVAAVCAEVGFARAVARVDGEVAVLAWDATEGRLWLARDPAGARPLAWARVGAGVVVASDPAALLRHPGLATSVDPLGLARGVALGLLPPPRTALVGVQALAPGEQLAVDTTGARSTPAPPPAVNPAGVGGASARWARSVEFASALAVRQRLPAGTEPVAVAFSGGAFARGVARLADAGAGAGRRRPPPVLLTLADDAGLAEARAGATSLGWALDEVAVPEAELPGLVDAVGAAGLVAPEAVGWWALAARAWALGLPVVLTGVGGAETHRVADARRHRLLDPLADLGGLSGRLAARLAPRSAERSPDDPRALFPDATPDEPVFAEVEALAARLPPGPPDARRLALERALVLPEARLRVLDAAGAAHQVSLRAPLAAAPLATLVATIPVGHLRRAGVARALWLEAVGDPEAPPPRPMSLPLGAWLRGPLGDELALLPARLEGVVAPAHVEALVAGVRAGDPRGERRLWALLLTARWLATLPPRVGGRARG